MDSKQIIVITWCKLGKVRICSSSTPLLCQYKAYLHVTACMDSTALLYIHVAMYIPGTKIVYVHMHPSLCLHVLNLSYLGSLMHSTTLVIVFATWRPSPPT